MRNLLRSILGILVVIVCLKVFALFVFLCYIGFFVPEPQNPLENIEDKIKQVEKKERVLTENEKELEKKSTEKEWKEVDNNSNK